MLYSDYLCFLIILMNDKFVFMVVKGCILIVRGNIDEG